MNVSLVESELAISLPRLNISPPDLEHHPSHPKVSVMVNNALAELNDRKGSSLQAIKKYIGEKYEINTEKQSVYIKKYLKTAVADGIIIQMSGRGATGSFKLQKTGEHKPLAVVNPTKQKTSKKGDKESPTHVKPSKASTPYPAIKPRKKLHAIVTKTMKGEKVNAAEKEANAKAEKTIKPKTDKAAQPKSDKATKSKADNTTQSKVDKVTQPKTAKEPKEQKPKAAPKEKAEPKNKVSKQTSNDTAKNQESKQASNDTAKNKVSKQNSNDTAKNKVSKQNSNDTEKPKTSKKLTGEKDTKPKAPKQPSKK